MSYSTKSAALTIAAVCLPFSTLLAQPHRILKGNVSPHVQPRFDRGRVEPNTRMGQMSLVLQRTAAQQAELETLLANQQDPGSSQYHQWLTPEQFAGRFGASQQDVDKLSAWLAANGFTVNQVARGRDYITFTGVAAQVEAALRTEIHHYSVNGEMHYANASEPSLPQDLAAVVTGIRGLNDFRPKSPRHQALRPAAAVQPGFFSKAFPDLNVLAPDDLATIYNINALYRAGIDGSGQKIAVVGESDIDVTD
ncbi:MAG TPA: protease pro-enzyme activation domain-containing protein, partial [Bryobacteraceae bacterium]